MRRRWKIGIAAGVLLCILIIAAIGLLASYTAREIERRRHDILGLALNIEGYHINWLQAQLVLKGIQIFPARREHRRYLLASADALEIVVWPSLTDILKGRLHIKEVTLNNPFITYVRTGPKKHNWDVLELGKGETKKTRKTESFEPPVWIDTVKIEGGRARYRDHYKGQRMDLTEIDATVSHIVYEPRPEVLPTRIKATARLGQTKGRMSVKGRANLLAQGFNFKVKGRIDKAPITHFHSFYRGQTPFKIRSGTLYVKSKAKSKRSKLTSQHHATIYNLKAAGAKGKIINALVLMRGGKVKIDATVNGDLDSGNFFVSSEISRGLSRGIWAQAREGAPLKKTGEKIKELGSSVGRGIEGIFKRK